jgi:hypothetical protein
MSQIGDVEETKSARVSVPVTISITGTSRTGFFRLSRNPDIAHYYNVYGNVKIVGEIVCEAFGPVTSTQATVICVALYPDKYGTDGPSEAVHIQKLEGRVYVQQSLAFGQKNGSPQWPRETTPILKPKTLVDYPPVLAYHLEAPGGTATSVSTLTAHVVLEVHGACHKKTW